MQSKSYDSKSNHGHNAELKLIMKQNPLTRKDIAEMLHVNIATVHAWLSPPTNKKHRTFSIRNLNLLKYILKDKKV